ncbi:MAG: ExeM/NucH family extracellular endonuclease, partial [Pseudomonadota bacterium]|nr:ExeM/NucH family extracellular endonuclease [Pseudomonadota bacterium]
MTSPILFFRAAFALAAGLIPSVGLAEPACGRPTTPIATIQGHGPASPRVGETVTVEGILTLDSRIEGGFGGFYLQQADSEADQDPQTSEALFVYTRRKAGQPGRRLRVTGTVKEFHGLTELVSIQGVTDCGPAPIPEPILVTLPWSQPPEQLENMRVRFAEPLTIVDNDNLARYGELALAAADQIQPTELRPPGPAAQALSVEQQRQRVRLDDNRSQRNPRPVPWPPEGLAAATTLRAGDRVSSLEGVLDFRFDAWRLQPASPPVFVNANPRPPAPTRPPEASLRIMALNLANYFNGDGRGEGFPTPRGADTDAGFRRQQARLVNALLAPDPDILAVTELENDGYGPDSAIASLARALGEQWQYVRTPEADGNDAIRTALLFRADRVNALCTPRRQTPGPIQSAGRPPQSHAVRPSG